MRNQTASDEQDDVARLQYALNGKIMLCSVVLLVAAVFVIFGFHTCLLRRRHSRRRRTRRRLHLFQSPDLPTAAAASAPVGLDLSVLKSLPTFAYSSAVHDPLLECAVCLSEFENDETGRVLPKCNHTFHVDCIDMWFRSHSNCPLCRSPVQTGIPVPDSIQISVQAIFLVHEQAHSEAQPGSELCRKHEAEAGSSSTSVWLAVEEPREPEETGPGSGSPGMISPGDRVLSLKMV